MDARQPPAVAAFAPESQLRGRVLVVENNAESLQALTHILGEEGFEVFGCATADEALRRCAALQGTVVVVLVDLDLLNHQVVTWIEQLRALDDGVRVIALGTPNPQVRAGVPPEACSFVEKPITLVELMRLVYQAFLRHLREQRDRDLRRFLDGLPAAAYCCQLDGRITYFNERAAALWGRSPQLNSAVDRYCGAHQLISAEGLLLTHDHSWMALALHRDCSFDGKEIIVERADGSRRTVLAYVNTFHDDRHRLQGAVNVLVDITEQKRAEQLARSAEERFRALVEKIAEAIVLCDPEGRILYASPAVERLLGVTPDSLLGQVRFDLAPVEDRERLQALLGQAVATPGFHAPFQTRCRHQDGSWRWIEGTISNHLQTPGVEAIVVSAHDVTAARQAAQALQESEARSRRQLAELETLYHTAPIGFALLDREFRFLRVNSKLARINGVPVEEHAGRTLREIAPAVADSVEPLLRQVFDTGQPILQLEVRGKFPHNDTERCWLTSYAPLVEPNGAVQFVSAMVQDITERKLAEERFRHVLESAPDAMVIVNQSGHIILVNSQAEEMFGYSRTELLGQPIELLVPLRARGRLPGHRRAYFTQPIVRQMGMTGDVYALRKDGHEFPVEIRLSPLQTPEGLMVCSTVRDITQRKQAEQALQESEARSRQQLAELESLYLTAPTGMALIDRNFRYLRINEKLAEINGLPVTAYLGRTLREVLPEIADAGEPVFRRVFETGEPILNLEGRGRLPHQTTDHHWLLNVAPVKEPSGAVTAISATVQDITSRKQAEELLRVFIEQVPAPIAMFDTNMRYLAVSARWLAAYRIPEANILGRSQYDVFPEIPEWWKGVHQRCLAGAVEKCDNDRFVRVDGRVQWLQWEVRPWYTSEGAIGGILIFSEDITDRKASEDALRLSEARFRALAIQGPVGIIMTDERGHATFVNEHWCRMARLTAEQAQGSSWVQALHPDDWERVTSHWYKSVAAKRTFASTYRFCGPGGTIWVQGRALPLLNERGDLTGYLGTVSDITEQKLSEERVQLTLKATQDLTAHLQSVREEERQRIAREIHDELGQALTHIKLDVAWLQQRLKPNADAKADARFTEMRQHIDGTIQSIRRIISELRPGILDHLGLVAALEWLAQDAGESAGIVCTTEMPAEDLALSADQSTGLFRICQEALTNAVRHAQARNVVVRLVHHADRLQLHVADDGQGMPAMQARGRSFGLQGVQERATFLGGILEIESHPGAGTTLVVSIPYSASASQTADGVTPR